MKRPIDVPLDWSPEQAITVLEFLDSVITWIWCLYGDAIQRADRDGDLPPAFAHARGVDPDEFVPDEPDDDYS